MNRPHPTTAPTLAAGPARRRGSAPLLLIALGALAWQFGFGLYRAIYNNFLVEVHGIRPDQLGAIESIREIPGLLVVLLVAAVAGLAPSLVAGCCVLLVAAGMFLYPFADGFWHLVAITLVFSTGFHLLFPPQNTLVLHHAGEGQKGKWLGWMDSIGAGAALLAMAAAAVLATRLQFSGLFFLGGAVVLLGAVAFLLTPGPRRLSARGRGLGFRREFGSYYVMTLLQGARRHFFLVFALYNLVEVHGVATTTIATLLAVSGLASVFTRPMLGRLADRFGVTRVLIWCYSLVGLVFAGYAFIHDLTLIYLLFCLDSIITFELVIVLHAYRVAQGGEVASALAGGSTVGHITGVIVPFAGGLLWKYVGPEATFLCGVLVCAIGAAYAWNLERRERSAAGPAGGSGSPAIAGSGPSAA